MPYVNSCWFSKKDIQRDEDFLKSLGLTEEQLSSTLLYFQQRLSANALMNALVFLSIAFGAFVLGYMAG